MATTTNGISTEYEAYNKLQLQSYPSGYSANRAITKTRLFNAFDGSLYNENSYTSDQCVKYSDIFKYDPVLNDYYYCSELAIMSQLSQGDQPAYADVPLRLDSDFMGSWSNPESGKYYATYDSFVNDKPSYPNVIPIQQSLLSHYESYYNGYGTPAGDNSKKPIPADRAQSTNFEDCNLLAISGCTPWPTINPPCNTTFYQVHQNCINNPNNQYFDIYNNLSAFEQEFIVNQFQQQRIKLNILGTVYYNYNNNLPTFNTINNCVINLKFGQEFFIAITRSGDKAEWPSYFNYVVYMQEYDDYGMISGSFSRPALLKVNTHVNTNIGDMIDVYIFYDYRFNMLGYTFDINQTKKYGALFTITHMCGKDLYLLKIRRTGNEVQDDKGITHFLITPYITNIAIDLQPGKVDQNDDINLWYNYDNAPHAGWGNIYPESLQLNTQYMGLDTCAMYQIRFITGYNLKMSAEEMLVPSLPKEGGYSPIPIRIGNSEIINPSPFYFDLCIPNPKMSFPIREMVTQLKLDPSSTLYKSGFAISYLRSPVILNVMFDNIPGAKTRIDCDPSKTHTNSTFIYETLLKRFYGNKQPTLTNYDMFYHMIKHIRDIFQNTYTPNTENAWNILLASVPYIFVKCEYKADVTQTLIYHYFDGYWDFSSLSTTMRGWYGYDIFNGRFFSDYLFPKIEYHDEGWIGIPEFLFFHVSNEDLVSNVFRNRINVIDRPRAVNIVIPLDHFGNWYNEQYGKEIGILNEIYVYYKTYFYHYTFE